MESVGMFGGIDGSQHARHAVDAFLTRWPPLLFTGGHFALTDVAIAGQ